jgi:hypothetical protein
MARTDFSNESGAAITSTVDLYLIKPTRYNVDGYPLQ